jgi:hypothetical protein
MLVRIPRSFYRLWKWRRRSLADSTAILADKIACAELIQAWGVARDQGKWKDLRATFTPDGHISVSWFRGSFEQFVERCRAAFNAGHTWSRHHLFPPTITLNGDRAIAETPVVIRVRQKFGGIDVDLTSCSRFLDRVERHSGGWLIAERAAIQSSHRRLSTSFSPRRTPHNIRSSTATWRFASLTPKAARWRR